MRVFKAIVTAVMVLCSASALAKSHTYAVTFAGEPTANIEIADEGEPVKVASKDYDSGKLVPMGFVNFKQSAQIIKVQFSWWGGELQEVSDGHGTHLSLIAGTCDATSDMGRFGDIPVNVSVSLECNENGSKLTANRVVPNAVITVVRLN